MFYYFYIIVYLYFNGLHESLHRFTWVYMSLYLKLSGLQGLQVHYKACKPISYYKSANNVPWFTGLQGLHV